MRFPTMWYVRPAKPQISLAVKLLTEHHLEFLNLEAAQAHLSLNLPKCHIVGNQMPWLICYLYSYLVHVAQVILLIIF